MNSKIINILITRPKDRLGDVRNLFPGSKFNLHPFPTITFKSVLKTPDLDETMSQISTCSIHIYTSQIAALNTFEYLRHLNRNLKSMSAPYVCAIGPSTAHYLCSKGIPINLMPRSYCSLAVSKLFPKVKPMSRKIFMPRSNMASELLREDLTHKGYQVISPTLYETNTVETADKDALNLIDSGLAHCIGFTSPSSVKALIQILGYEKFKVKMEGMIVSAIGPTTAEACYREGIHVAVQPRDSTLQSFGREITNFYKWRNAI